ncbi:MAG: non-homologous end-joining DNA ligase [Actinomycetota bacterium]
MSEIKVGRRSVAITKPDKVLFPDGITKRDLVDYYLGVGDVMVPQVKDHLFTLERYPDGIAGKRWFQKGAPDYFPDWIRRVAIPKKGGEVAHVVCNDKATLAYLANQAAITMHMSLSRADAIDHPDRLVFDLDPAGDDFKVVQKVAGLVRDLLDELSLVSFVKTSGSRGLHIVVPIDRAANFETARAFAQDASGVVAADAPRLVTIESRKAKREGRLFLDYMRNAYAQTVVAPYSVRARPGAPVSMPISWDEVGDRKLGPQRYRMDNAVATLERSGDPWKGWRRRAKSLTAARARLDKLLA